MSKLNIAKAAAEFREKIGYSTNAPIRIKSLLQQLNVLAVFRELEGTFSGMSIKIDDERFMLINSSHSIGRQHFTILHELYHLYIQKNFESIVCDHNNDTKEKKEEENADLFASYLMLPKDGIIKLIPENELKKDKIKINTIIAIEQYYSCSHAAMLRRLEEIDLLSKEKSEELSKDIKINARLNGYDTALYESGNKNLVIGDYGVKAKRLFDEDLISQSHYLELMMEMGFNFEKINDANEK